MRHAPQRSRKFLEHGLRVMSGGMPLKVHVNRTPSCAEGTGSGYTSGYTTTWRPALPYQHPPLALVVCEIRFLEVDTITDDARMLIRDHVRPMLPLSEKQIQDIVTFQYNPAAPVASAMEKTVLPRFMSRERTSALVVSPSSMVVETTIYPGYDNFFRELLAQSIRGVAEALRPDGVMRVGLRYIDEIRVPEVDSVPGQWHGYINEALLATVAPEFLSATGLTPETWQGFVRYSTGPGSALAVRYGPATGHAVPPDGPTRRPKAPPPGVYFLLDSDSFWEAEAGVPEFEAEAILNICDHLHDPTRAIFEAVSTDRLRNEVYGGYVTNGDQESGDHRERTAGR